MSKVLRQTKSQRAFTLLELLVVMAIMALLVGLGLRTFGSVQQKSRDGRRKQDLQSIGKALELYYNDFGHYPFALEGKIMGCGEGAVMVCSWSGVWQNTSNDTLYMSKLPQDPGGGQYYYQTNDTGSWFYLFAYLENTEDEKIARDANDEPAFYTNTICKIANGSWVVNSCNYAIMSTNMIIEPSIAVTEP